MLSTVKCLVMAVSVINTNILHNIISGSNLTMLLIIVTKYHSLHCYCNDYILVKYVSVTISVSEQAVVVFFQYI